MGRLRYKDDIVEANQVNRFLGAAGTADEVCAVVIPAPLENTTSFPTGTAHGPAAFLRASAEIESFEAFGREVSGRDAARVGTETRAALALHGLRNEDALKILEAEIAHARGEALWPLVIGGERTLSIASAQALRGEYPEAGIVVFAGRPSLRERHEGSLLHRACTLRRLHESGVPVAVIGPRVWSRADADYVREHRLPWASANEVMRDGFDVARWLGDFPAQVHIAFDLGVFDPAVAPGTGTPDPEGLSWSVATRLLDQLFASRDVVGADISELFPIAGSAQTETLAARLACRLVTNRFITESESSASDSE